jgi:hypothetical protein
MRLSLWFPNPFIALIEDGHMQNGEKRVDIDLVAIK